MTDSEFDYLDGAGVLDTVLERGPKRDLRPANAASFYPGQRINIKPDLSSPSRGQCTITDVNLKDGVLTTDGLPEGTTAGDLVLIWQDEWHGLKRI